MVTCKETCAVIIALHKKGFTCQEIAAGKIATKSTIYRIIKNFKERFNCCEEGFRVPKKVQQAPGRLLNWIQLQDRAPPVHILLRNGSRQV